MKPIRHLIAIVFLLCSLTAQGSGKVYDHYDMAGTYKYEIREYVLNLHLHTDNTFMIVADDSSRRFGRWNVDEDIILLHFIGAVHQDLSGNEKGSGFACIKPQEVHHLSGRYRLHDSRDISHTSM